MRSQLILLWVIVYTLLVSSCGVKLNNYSSFSPDQSIDLKPIFQPELKEFVFDLSMTYGKKKKNSGILAIVKDSIDTKLYRTVFMAKTGLKLFDFSFTNDKMFVNHIIPQLDKKIIKKILEKDLRLLMEDINGAKPSMKQLSTPVTVLNEYRYKKRSDYYRLTTDKSGQVMMVDQGKKNRSHVRMHIKYKEDMRPSEISIEHLRIPFSMRLISLSSN